MKLINKEKAEAFAQATGMEKADYAEIDYINGIKTGIAYAGQELENLAIEFGVFLGKKHYRYNEIMLHWFNDRMSDTFTTEELFYKFIENKQNEN